MIHVRAVSDRGICAGLISSLSLTVSTFCWATTPRRGMDPLEVIPLDGLREVPAGPLRISRRRLGCGSRDRLAAYDDAGST